MAQQLSLPSSRQDFLRDAVAEAGRALLARLLLEERRRPYFVKALAPETLEAMQTLRDAASAARRARSGR